MEMRYCIEKTGGVLVITGPIPTYLLHPSAPGTPRPHASAAQDGKENGAAAGGSALGGKASGGSGGGAQADMRAARAAHFEAMLAQQAAKRAAGAALLNE